MTYCETLAEPLKKKVEVEKKNLDQLAKELCGNTVKRPRQKVIRLIKELIDEDYLIKHAEILGYNPVKAVRQKSTSTKAVKRKIVSETQEYIDATADADSPAVQCQKCDEQESKSTAHDFNELVSEIKRLISIFSLEDVKKAISIVES